MGSELLVIVEGTVRVVRIETRRHRERSSAPTSPAITSASSRCSGRARGRRTVIADGDDVRTLVIDGQSLKAILRERPEAAMAMLATLAERISVAVGSGRSAPVGATSRREPSHSSAPMSKGRCRCPDAWSRWDESQREPPRPRCGRRSSAHGGVIVRTEGDALFAVFPEAGAGGRGRDRWAASAGRASLAGDAQVRVRMGLHSGEAHLAGDDYGGFEVNRAARIAAAGTAARSSSPAPTRPLAGSCPAAITVRDLGRARAQATSRARSGSSSSTRACGDLPPFRTGDRDDGNLPTD